MGEMLQPVEAGNQVLCLQELTEIQLVGFQFVPVMVQSLALVCFQHFGGIGAAALLTT